MKIFGRKLTSIILLICILSSFSFCVQAAGVNLEAVDGINLWPTNVEVDGYVDDTVAYSGKCSYKVINHTPQGPMQYFIISWAAKVEAGKSYVVGGKFKAEDAGNVHMDLPGDEKISISGAFGKTYDWKNVEVAVSPDTSGEYRVMIILESSGTMWFDDIGIWEKDTNRNLIENGGFEVKETEPTKKPEKPSVDGSQLGNFQTAEEYQEQLNALLESPKFKVEDLRKFNNPGAVPLFRADGITTDGSGKGWENYKPFIMTIPTTNYVDYLNVGSDINGEIKTAFDDENLYVHAVINDDIFCSKIGDDNYWSGDGVQMTFSQNDVFGKEIGVAWNDEIGKASVYSVYLNKDQIADIGAKIVVGEGKQIYDIVLPWNLLFDGGKPERFQFNMCFNDCDDGQNRHDCMEIAPGILRGKSAVGNPIMELFDGKKEWYAWFKTEGTGTQESDLPGVVWIVNESAEEKSFVIKSEECGIAETVTIPSMQGIRCDFSYKCGKAGQYAYSISVENDGYIQSKNVAVTVSYPIETPEYAEKLIQDCTAWGEELQALVDQCEKKGINPQYEKISVFVMQDFAKERIPEDVKKNLFYRMAYWRKTLTEIYENTKERLNSYLSGEKTAITAPVYQTSDLKIQGSMFYGDTIWDGIFENRPVVMTGYLLHYPLIDSGITDMPKVGANAIALEYTLGSVIMSADNCEAISAHWPNNVTGEAVRTEEEAYEGKYSYKISKTNDAAPGSYRHIRTYCPTLKPGTTYTYSFWAKSVDCGDLKWSISGGKTHTISGTTDWTQYTETFTTGENQTEVTFDHIMAQKSTAVYYDNISLVEEGTEENLIPDSGFEDVPEEFFEKGYYVRTTPMDLSRFESAAENNQSVDVLITLGHIIPQFLIDRYPEIFMQSSGFNVANFASPKFREIVEEYLRCLMENLKDQTCINSFDLANEVQINTYKVPELYLPRFRNWLLNKYGSIEALNAAYGSSYPSFEDIGYPTSSTAKEPLAVDFDEYSDWELADFHRFAANIIHEYMPDIPIYTKIMDYNQDYGDIHMYAYQTNGTGLDAYADVFNINGCDAYSYLDWDKGRLVKMQWYDYMASTNWAPIINGEDHVLKDSGLNYDDNLAYFVANDLWQGAVHYRGQTEIWLWDSREEEVETKGSIKCRPDAIVKTGEAGLDLMRLSYEIEALQKEKRDIGILYSNASAVHTLSYPGCQYYAYEATVFSGKKVKYVSENNISGIFDTKLLLIPQCQYVRKETLEAIKQYIEQGGKVVIIGKNSLKNNVAFGESDPELVDYIYAHADFVQAESDRFKQGLTEGSVEEIYQTINQAIDKAGLKYVTLVDAETNREVYDVEYTYTIYDGKLLINIANWKNEEKKLKVLVNGKEVTGFTELRSKEKVDGDIQAEYLKPILLAADWEGDSFLDTIGNWAEDTIQTLHRDGIVSGMTETRYEPNREITRAEFLSLLMRTGNFSGQYRNQIADVSTDAWYADAVAAGLSAGVIDRDNFRPNEVITRDEMAEMLIRAVESRKGVLSQTGESFKDQAQIKNQEAVGKASGAGLLSGYEDGSFRPENGLTRAEVASVILRYRELVKQ